MSDDLLSDGPPQPQAGRDLEGQRILDRIRSRVFGVETGPTRVGRWQILHKLGKGAMGTVYAAYDPDLDRRVAIKVLHGMSPEAEHARRIRLRREAQAMARVDHANLVRVYDVCADAPQPYVVMELIEGQTLRAWQEHPERTWRELTQAYLGAARGLAALHEARLFHRDFKPDNALREPTGRVRVVDFGLVFSDDVDHEPQNTRPPALTREGALVGTIAYMSPEQLMGGRGDAYSDQFSLCRSLYEAVYRARPFVGDDPDSLLAEMQAGPPPLKPNPRGAPRWLGAQILRGLAFDPRRRFKTMDELATRLDKALHRRPIRIALSLGAFGALALGAATVVRGAHPCDRVEDELIDAWDSRQEPAIRRMFLAQDIPGGSHQWAALSTTMQRNRQRWLALRGETCRERHAGDPAGWVLQRDRCLGDARLILQSLARGYQSPTPLDIIQAGEAAANLALRIDDCARIGPRDTGPAPPDLTPRLEASLADAEAEQFAGRLRRAEEAARRALEAAERSGVRAAVAEALHRLGRVLGHARRPDEALTTLDRAAREAIRAGHDRLYIDARLFAAKLRVLDFAQLDRAAQDAVDAEDFIERLDIQGADILRQTAELHEVRGFAARERHEYDAALTHFHEALQLHRQRLDPESSTPTPLDCRFPGTGPGLMVAATGNLDVIRTLNNLALVLSERSDPDDHHCLEQLYRAALAAADTTLGPLHPLTLEIRYDFAVTLRDMERDDEALQILRPSLDATVVQFGEHNAATAESLLLLATLALDRKDITNAKVWSAQAAALFAKQCTDQGCPRNYGNALVLQGEHARATKDLPGALNFYQAALEPLAHAGAEVQHADCTLYIAETLADLDRLPEARSWLDRALPQFERQGRETDPGLKVLFQRLQPPSTPEIDHAPNRHRPKPRPI